MTRHADPALLSAMGGDPAEMSAEQQQREHDKRQRDAHGQRTDDARTARVVAHQEEQSDRQAADHEDQQQDEHAFEHVPHRVESTEPYYAPPNPASPAAVRRHFRPRAASTLAMLVVVPVCLWAAQWQWHKAALKTERAAEQARRLADPPVVLPTTNADPARLRDRRVVVDGHYEGRRQILIDNQIWQGQAGYRVVTPFRLAGSDTRVLVDRGWAAGTGDRRPPDVSVPDAPVRLTGIATIPGTRFFSLADDKTFDAVVDGQTIWQRLDLERFRSEAPYPVQPLVIELDEGSSGALRVAPLAADDKRLMNLGYAFQWACFAATGLALWLSVSFRREG